MGTFSQRKYIFRRRPFRARMAFAGAAICAALLAMNFGVAFAKPGGFFRSLMIEEPAD